MNDRNLVRGVFLLAIALAFGLGSLRYQIGSLSRPGPGLFPLLVSLKRHLVLLHLRLSLGLCFSTRIGLFRRLHRLDLILDLGSKPIPAGNGKQHRLRSLERHHALSH